MQHYFHAMARNPNWTRDELILALDLYVNGRGPELQSHHPEVVRLSELLNALHLHSAEARADEFRNPNGVAMKLANFLSIDPNHPGTGLRRGNRLEQEVWDEFAHDSYRLRKIALSIADQRRRHVAEPKSSYHPNDDEDEFPEGRVLTRLHKERERDREAVKRKKQQVLGTEGKLVCEACDFDFAERYGALGTGFAECHHRVPLADLGEERRTRLADLAIVCANCHRMLHRIRPVLTVPELRSIVQQNAALHSIGTARLGTEQPTT